MTTVMDDLPDYLRDRGFKVVGVTGWRTRKRPITTGGWKPKGVVAHHTGGKANGLAYAKGILAEGRTGLPGPLCQLALNRDGTVIFVAGGRANHAGKVRKVGFLKKGDGNTQSLGIEAMNTGTEGWSKPRPKNPFGTQYKSYVALVAAVEDFFGWERGSVLGHGECSTAGKWDPGVKDKKTGKNRMLNMDVFRAAVKAVKFEIEPDPVVTRGPKAALINHNAASGVLKKIKNLRKWRKRRKPLIAEVVSIGADVFGGLECGGGSTLSWITKKYTAAKYVRLPGGRGGRHIWAMRKHRVLATGYFEPDTHHKDKNDKPAPWAVIDINGEQCMFVLSHLDARDKTRKLQVAQQSEIVTKALRKAASMGIDRQSMFFMSDMADNGEAVLKKVFIKKGFKDGLPAAIEAHRTQYDSYNQYKKPKKGKRGDVIVVDDDRPVLVSNQRFTLNTDHHHQVIISGRLEA